MNQETEDHSIGTTAINGESQGSVAERYNFDRHGYIVFTTDGEQTEFERPATLEEVEDARDDLVRLILESPLLDGKSPQQAEPPSKSGKLDPTNP